ncbi:hypothetical protein GCM10009835_05260 [Planosporangium flavigriseum]|uniref:Uncharacterized protein n=2 Tax=Planosporangium flavigriseum TaxID=373681 RepID=A0A8J3LJV6_9ACTN|nr:hypothetical protein Pfl04_15360 [Planosporangium flavigriseum]
MDSSLHVTVGGLYAGLVIGFGGGWLYAVCRRAWRDLAGAKSTAAAAGKTAWARTLDLIVLGFLLAVAAALMLGNIGGG